MVFLTFGTGMGAGLILDKKLYRGTNDLAGEVGAVRLAESGPVGYNLAGSFEGFCSGGGIGRLAQLALQKNPDKKTVLTPDSLSAQAVFEAVRSGDELAEEVVAECAKYLGRGLAVIVNMLNPQKIVIGSIFIRQKKLLWPIAEAELKKDAIPMSLKACKIVSAKLGEQVGDYASLAVAMTAGKV
jgi:glucokinase